MGFFKSRPAAAVGLLGGMFGMVLMMALASVAYTGEGYGSPKRAPVMVYPNL